MSCRLEIDQSALEHLYIGQELSLDKTASAIGVSASTIARRLIESNIARRKRGSGSGNSGRTYIRTPEQRLTQSIRLKRQTM